MRGSVGMFGMVVVGFRVDGFAVKPWLFWYGSGRL